jgi:hypothetical protein
MTPVAPLLSLMLLAPQVSTFDRVGDGPEPSPTLSSWQLDLRFNEPRRIEVLVPGSSQPEVYWYVVYTVVNTSSRTQDFRPNFQIVTEDLRVIDTDVGVHPLVFNSIRELHRVSHPDLLPPSQAGGELRVGVDNARESVAIWRPFELKYNHFTVYVAGLSGELKFVKNPSYDSSKPETEPTSLPQQGAGGNPKFFVLRKTLELRYNLPGSVTARPLVQPERLDMRWILR